MYKLDENYNFLYEYIFFLNVILIGNYLIHQTHKTVFYSYKIEEKKLIILNDRLISRIFSRSGKSLRNFNARNKWYAKRGSYPVNAKLFPVHLIMLNSV